MTYLGVKISNYRNHEAEVISKGNNAISIMKGILCDKDKNQIYNAIVKRIVTYGSEVRQRWISGDIPLKYLGLTKLETQLLQKLEVNKSIIDYGGKQVNNRLYSNKTL